MHSVETLTVQSRTREMCSLRKDYLSDEVLCRLSSINDLVAEKAVYHKDCYIYFLKPTSLKTPKTEMPRDSHIKKAMEEIFNYLEGSSDCQFSKDEILGIVSETKPRWRKIKAELERKYGDRILITQGVNRFCVPVICFRDSGKKIISEATLVTFIMVTGPKMKKKRV